MAKNSYLIVIPVNLTKCLTIDLKIGFTENISENHNFFFYKI